MRVCEKPKFVFNTNWRYFEQVLCLLAGWLLNLSTVSELRKSPALSCPREVASVTTTRQRKAVGWWEAGWSSFGNEGGGWWECPRLIGAFLCSGSSLGKGQESMLFEWPALSARRESQWGLGKVGLKELIASLSNSRLGGKSKTRLHRRLCGGTKCDPALLEGVAWKKRATHAQHCLWQILLHHSECGTPSTSHVHRNPCCSNVHQQPSPPSLS